MHLTRRVKILTWTCVLGLGGAMACGSDETVTDRDGDGPNTDSATDGGTDSPVDAGGATHSGGSRSSGGSKSSGGSPAPPSGGRPPGEDGGAGGDSGEGGDGGSSGEPVDGEAVCTEDGWCWELPLPHGNVLYSMTEADGHAWAVGESGTIVHRSPEGVYDTFRYPGIDTLFGVDAVSSDDVWAVGQEGVILHFTGENWHRVPSGTTLVLRGVRAFSADDVWIGGSNFAASTVLLRLVDGVFVPFSQPNVTMPQVTFIAGQSRDDWYIGGLAKPSATLVRVADTTLSYSGFYADTNIDITAATWFQGSLYVSSSHNDGHIGRRSDGPWSYTRLYNVGTVNAQRVYGLAGTADRLFIAGERELLSFDGSTYRSEWHAGSAIGKHFVHAGESGVFFGGPGGRIFEWHEGGSELEYGSEWSGHNYSGDVFVRSENDVWRFGYRPMHYDGQSWSDVTLPFADPFGVVSRGSELYVTDGDDGIYAMGPSGWERRGTGPRPPIENSWVSPSGRLFVTWSRYLYSTESLSPTSTWTLLGEIASSILNVHGTSDDNVWIVGMGGNVAYWDGAEMHDLSATLDTTRTLHALLVLSPTSVWLSGLYTTAFHWNGSTFTPHDLDLVGYTVDIEGTSDDNVWALTRLDGFDVQRANVWHFNGSTWRKHDAAIGHVMTDLAVPNRDTAWVSGNGSLLRWTRP